MIKYWASPSRATTLAILQLCPVANTTKRCQSGSHTQTGYGTQLSEIVSSHKHLILYPQDLTKATE